MSQRKSGYVRQPNDSYPTPHWVTEALLPHIADCSYIWEPAAGAGKMASVLRRLGEVVATDITWGTDFLKLTEPVQGPFDAIVTNPPFWLAQSFIEHALRLQAQSGYGKVAMVLRIDYDSAKTRTHLFKDNPHFAKKIVLTKRIRWFENSTGSPSFNHCWMIWDMQHQGPPTISYA